MPDTTTPTTRVRFFDLTVILTSVDGESIECKYTATIEEFQALVEKCVANNIKLEVIAATISKHVS